jgi:mRNA-degrading endonuclease toxin of MazEF toxin-antitoxin module
MSAICLQQKLAICMFKTNKKDLDNPVTMRDFNELTHGIAEIVVTKDEFKEYTNKVFKTFATKQDLEELKRDLPSKKYLDAHTDKMLKHGDALMREVKAMREEKSAHSINHKDITDTNVNQEQRIRKLESHAGI